MTNSTFRNLGAANTPQSEALDDRQVANNAGGFVYEVDRWDRLDRFLVLGTESGTYYAGERELTLENLSNIRALIAEDGPRVVTRVVEFRVDNRAPKTDTLILVLALCASAESPVTRKMALNSLGVVCRYATEMFNFCAFVQQFRGWGHGLRRAVAQWYESRDASDIAYQAVKYRQRNGWTHRDVLRLSHPRWLDDPERRMVYEWICRGTTPEGDSVPAQMIRAHMAAMGDSPIEVAPNDVANLIRRVGLPWEAVSTEYLRDPNIWGALMESSALPNRALLRNLARMTMNHTFSYEDYRDRAVERINNFGKHLHPYEVMLAMITYASGRSFRGSGSWTPVRQVVEALDAAFYAAFGSVEPTGKRIQLALDVSGSMDDRHLRDSVVSAREAAAAMALVTASVEPNYTTTAFTSAGSYPWTEMRSTMWALPSISEIDLSSRRRLDDVISYVRSLPFAGTDCALPMLWAAKNKRKVDAFIIYTDNETWAGDVHPAEALRQYRKASGIHDAKLVVVGMTATDFTIADPNDPGMLDVVGFDASAPGLIADFIRG